MLCGMVLGKDGVVAKASLNAFLLTRQWRDAAEGLEYEFWAASDEGPLRVRMTAQEAVFFVPRDAVVAEGRRAQVDLRTLEGQPVDALYFRSQRDLANARGRLKARGISLRESDVKPADRFLMERFVTGPLLITGDCVQRAGFREFVNPRYQAGEYRPTLKVASVDIETEGLDGRLYSIAVAASDSRRVLMVGSGADSDAVAFHEDERSLIEAFLAHLDALDPDLIVGWNVIDFDLQFLARRCARLDMPFALGRDRGVATVLPSHGGQPAAAQVPGRVILDGIATMRAAMYQFDSYRLEAVAQSLLGRGKLVNEPDRVEEINRLYREDPSRLAAYNLEDCGLVLDIFAHARLVEFAMERASLTGLPLGRPGGSVAAFDFLYLPRLHRHGFVAPDLDAEKDLTPSPGGYIIDSQPGLYENVVVLDFKSLYPSIIRTFHVDPLALAVPGDDPIPGFEGAACSRDTSILPDLIESLWRARDQAKREHNRPLAQAIKILMNSFYGVLGMPACRFFNPQLAGSITRYGHRIITESRDFLEDHGRQVIYGDTDSLFVLLGPGHDESAASAAGREMADSLNRWWRERVKEIYKLDSYLEIEFEVHYLRFLMPTNRRSDKGSKKRYAGLVRGSDGTLTVSFTGLESVRTDWTPLARNFQRELCRRIFCDEPFKEYVSEVARDLMAGRLDDQLVYRKRLRKPLEEYRQNVPPHVQAARLESAAGGWVSYIVTKHGPRPASEEGVVPDYHHYLEHQLAPAADHILRFFKTSLGAILDRQLELF